MRTTIWPGVAAITIAVAVLLVGGSFVVTYHKLARLDQAATTQWAQVEYAYQRRADLVPGLLETAKSSDAVARSTLTGVSEARARVGQIGIPDNVTAEAAQFQQYQQAQDQLGAALSRLFVASAASPALANLQTELARSELQISIERLRFDTASNDFDAVRAKFPASIVAGLFGGRFTQKLHFAARIGADPVEPVTMKAEPPRMTF